MRACTEYIMFTLGFHKDFDQCLIRGYQVGVQECRRKFNFHASSLNVQSVLFSIFLHLFWWFGKSCWMVLTLVVDAPYPVGPNTLWVLWFVGMTLVETASSI